MRMLERRHEIERLLQMARGPELDATKRQVLWEALDAARADGTREMVLIATAAVLAAGGSFTMAPEVFARLPLGGGLEIISRPDTGDFSVRIAEQFAPLLQLLAGGGILTTFEAAAAPTEAYPPANVDESDDVARVRICEAVKLLTQRHYRGEFERRGFTFVSTVFGELVAMALGIERAHETDPKPMAQWLEDFGKDLAPQVEHYQAITEHLRDVGRAQPPAGETTRLH